MPLLAATLLLLLPGAASLSAGPLAAPAVIARGEGTVTLRVELAQDLSLALVEADMSRQADLVETALDAPSSSAAQDPYGVVLWPAAQVVARQLAALPALGGRRVVELGAGTGLCALAAAARGASTLATDYREEPFALLHASARASSREVGRPLEVETAVFDIKSAEPLPRGDVLVAADLLYLRSTSEALARRCVEALGSGYSTVLVGDCGRPGRAAFLDVLRKGGYDEQFVEVAGWAAVGERHELISSRGAADGAPCEISVGLLQLSAPADEALCGAQSR